jgi:hypothetical protein
VRTDSYKNGIAELRRVYDVRVTGQQHFWVPPARENPLLTNLNGVIEEVVP